MMVLVMVSTRMLMALLAIVITTKHNDFDDYPGQKMLTIGILMKVEGSPD